MAMFNSYVSLPEGKVFFLPHVFICVFVLRNDVITQSAHKYVFLICT